MSAETLTSGESHMRPSDSKRHLHLPPPQDSETAEANQPNKNLSTTD